MSLILQVMHDSYHFCISFLCELFPGDIGALTFKNGRVVGHGFPHVGSGERNGTESIHENGFENCLKMGYYLRTRAIRSGS